MLFTLLTYHMGSSGRLPPGCGPVQNDVHISVGGFTRRFHALKKHLPASELLMAITDVKAMPLFSSTRMFVT
jgi:hypothetical protein